MHAPGIWAQQPTRPSHARLSPRLPCPPVPKPQAPVWRLIFCGLGTGVAPHIPAGRAFPVRCDRCCESDCVGSIGFLERLRNHMLHDAIHYYSWKHPQYQPSPHITSPSGRQSAKVRNYRYLGRFSARCVSHACVRGVHCWDIPIGVAFRPFHAFFVNWRKPVRAEGGPRLTMRVSRTFPTGTIGFPGSWPRILDLLGCNAQGVSTGRTKRKFFYPRSLSVSTQLNSCTPVTPPVRWRRSAPR